MHRFLTGLFVPLFIILLSVSSSHAARNHSPAAKAEKLVADATETVRYFSQDSAYESLWKLAGRAKAVIIIPRSYRGGFMAGVSGGNAVMLVRNDDESWSQPSFLTLGSMSFGFQAGGEISRSILLVMTRRGVEQLISTSVKLGGDLSLSAGLIGGGAKVQTTDIIAFSRSQGLYGGISFEGAVLKTRHRLNREYYGSNVTPVDIIYRKNVSSPRSIALQNAVKMLVSRQHHETGRHQGVQTESPGNISPEDRIIGNDTDTVYEDDIIYGQDSTYNAGK